MSAQDLEQRARELLAAEYERDGKAGSAEHIRTQPLLPNKARAVRAIVAALRQQPAPVDLEQVDRTDRELLTEFIRICREHKPVGQWPGERLCTAIERMMERDKLFRFIAEADMAPERGHNGRGGDADRPFSGPRRAEPQQPAPVVDEACNWRQQDEDGDHISTGCGHEFILNDSGDYEDGRPVFSFCCFCSKPTMFHRWRDEPECSCDHSDGDAPECEGCADRRNRAALARAQGVQS